MNALDRLTVEAALDAHRARVNAQQKLLREQRGPMQDLFDAWAAERERDRVGGVAHAVTSWH